MQRASGILLPIFSLPSKYGIGNLGREAYRFIDFLASVHQAYWQVLPLGPTSPDSGNSPYSALSSFAGNPYFIDPDGLAEAGLLSPEDLEAEGEWGMGEIDYPRLDLSRDRLLRRAFSRFKALPPSDDYLKFLEENRGWLDDYALYRTLRTIYGRDWLVWPQELKYRDPEALEAFSCDHEEEVAYRAFLQYAFFRQYARLKDYAHSRGIQMIGDLPIYTPLDSADCWAKPHLFQLDEDLTPTRVSGVPPDAYSADGQVWNHPLYNWKAMEADGYAYWLDRLGMNARLFDLLRLDHFIGFTSYYAIPYGEVTARRGEWVKGPGLTLFETIRDKLPDLHLIAENLGSLTPEVQRVQAAMGYPGMVVLEFGFGGDDSPYLPHNYVKNSLAYSSTHDSDPFLAWHQGLPDEVKKRVDRYLLLNEEEGIHWGAVRALLASVSDLTIFPLQDILGLGREARINVPGVALGNWVWRAPFEYEEEGVIRQLKDLMITYRRYIF